MPDPSAFLGVAYDTYQEAYGEFLGLNGSLFFLGMVLSLVFIAAAVLIIYYKQISEGYEDQARFAIMQKVGMTDQEIRSSVNAQVRLVFLAPAVMAGVHLAFAFFMIRRILQVLGVNNLPLLLGVTVACYAVFVCLYALVYRGTARAYYQIVRRDRA